MKSFEELANIEARRRSPDASFFDVQHLGEGLFAVQAFETDAETEEALAVECYFVVIEAATLEPGQRTVARDEV